MTLKQPDRLSDEPPPSVALVWGWMGVVPLAACAIAALALTPETAALASRVAIAYGAIILTFIGGVHWGLAMKDIDASTQLYTVGIVPSIVALCAVLAPPVAGIPVLIAGFIALLGYDLWVVRRAFAPRWYARLRVPLTLSVVTCLAVVGFGH